MEQQLIGADLEFLSGQNLLIGAAVRIGGHAPQMGPGLALQTEQLDLQSRRGAATCRVQNMCC